MLKNSTFVIARRFLPKQSADIREIASLKNARNDNYKITRNEYIWRQKGLLRYIFIIVGAVA
jgi:hypothetical protein